jgi:hypothetical protein
MQEFDLDDDTIYFTTFQNSYVVSSLTVNGVPFGAGVMLPTREVMAPVEAPVEHYELLGFTPDGNYQAWLDGYLAEPVGYN